MSERRVRPVTFVIALFLVCGMVLGLADFYYLTLGRRSDDRGGPAPPTTSRSTPPAPQPTATASGQPSTTPTRPPPDPGDVPVASYDRSIHQVWPGYSSPDRTTNVSSNARPDGFTEPPPGSGVQRYLDQPIEWAACGTDQCATITVPLDWDQPDGQAIELALRKRVAIRDRIGSLFINPGGPGASGLNMLTSFQNLDVPNYDVIGWDPRGTGSSTPVKCGTNKQTDELNAVDASPDNDTEWQQLIAGSRAFAEQCRLASGVLLDNISTLATARDMDLMRYLVGDRKLNFLGISYGTYLGAMYAELYPKRVGRFVLDSAVNITENDSVTQTAGFDLALRNFADWCASEPCGLGDTSQAVLNRITGLWERLDQQPLAVEGRELTQSMAVAGIAAFLYVGDRGYVGLGRAVQAALQGDGRRLLQSADWLNGRDPDGSYNSLAYTFPAISCLDSADKGLAGARPQWRRNQQKAPLFGEYFGPSVLCPTWSAEPVEQLKLIGQGSGPILVVGVTGDPATPYDQAEWMADQLDGGVLLTWDGEGHSAWDLGNECVRRAMRNYLNEGDLPDDGTVC